MTGNFDFNTNTSDNTTDLTTYWEQAEQDYILDAEIRWYDAMMADDMEWRLYASRLNREIREAEEILAKFGITPSLSKLDKKFQTIFVY